MQEKKKKTGKFRRWWEKKGWRSRERAKEKKRKERGAKVSVPGICKKKAVLG